MNATSRKSLVVILAPLALAAAAATIYKWVDEGGVTHYSTVAPTGRKAVEIKAEDPPSIPTASGSRPAQKTPQEVLEEYRKSRIEREDAQRRVEAEEAKARANVIARKERCILARQNSYTLQQQRPVFKLNEKGEQVFVDDRARAAELERLAEEIKRFCEP